MTVEMCQQESRDSASEEGLAGRLGHGRMMPMGSMSFFAGIVQPRSAGRREISP